LLKPLSLFFKNHLQSKDNLEDSKMAAGRWREEAESLPPKVKSWRDTGDTPYRKNHQEEAKR
jgi:hypothetical protein